MEWASEICSSGSHRNKVGFERYNPYNLGCFLEEEFRGDSDNTLDSSDLVNRVESCPQYWKSSPEQIGTKSDRSYQEQHRHDSAEQAT